MMSTMPRLVFLFAWLLGCSTVGVQSRARPLRLQAPMTSPAQVQSQRPMPTCYFLREVEEGDIAHALVETQEASSRFTVIQEVVGGMRGQYHIICHPQGFRLRIEILQATRFESACGSEGCVTVIPYDPPMEPSYQLVPRLGADSFLRAGPSWN